jgi:hypothetical protein
MLISLLFACSIEETTVEKGRVEFCYSNLDFTNEENDSLDTFFLDGTLENISTDFDDCAVTLEIMSEDISYTIGYTIYDDSDNDATPVPSWALNTDVFLELRDKMVWGNTESLLLSDEDGLLLAIEQGYWGGSILAEDLPFSIEINPTPFDTKKEECITTEAHTILFDNNDVTPFNSEDITVDGWDYNVVAIGAENYGPGTKCEVSDNSDLFSWMLMRY